MDLRLPGLAAVSAYLGVERPHTAARELIVSAANRDVWDLIEAGFADAPALPESVRNLLRTTVGRVWSRRSGVERDALRVLSGMDVSAGQVEALLNRRTEVPWTSSNWWTIRPWRRCAHMVSGSTSRSAPSTVRASQGEGADREPLVASIADITDHHGERRVQALLVDVLEAAGVRGDTRLTQGEALLAAAGYNLARPPQLTIWMLEVLNLDSAALRGSDAWPIVGAELTGGEPGLKLRGPPGRACCR